MKYKQVYESHDKSKYLRYIRGGSQIPSMPRMEPLMSKINAEKLLTIVTKSPILQARRKREGFGGLQSPQIFAKADLLSLENDSVKEKIQKSKFKFLENCW